MVVKSKNAENHLKYLEVAFDILDKCNMKLNPAKCVFGVKAGKFLGYLVTKRGIEASPEQIQAILNLKSPTNVKEAKRTTPKNATGQTLFSLVFGAEAVILTEMVYPTARTSILDPQRNDENLLHDLDTVEELRDQARFRMAAYQQKMAGAYNKNIRIRRFEVGDLVFRKAFQNTTNSADGKLALKWEGPYLIEAEAGKGAYRLMNMEGDTIPRTWNAIHLKNYFC
ncbi:uncharacterized protein LOC143616159 [Bidens hawaiensis]|uniref:uncharacterized protein LOC143616159 n=1 Tax=Bidens hawaiensis TaxID=980011 RepID=UPI00404B16DD